MNTDRSIDILRQHITRSWPSNDPDLRIAETQGMEALERIKRVREAIKEGKNDAAIVNAICLPLPSERRNNAT